MSHSQPIVHIKIFGVGHCRQWSVAHNPGALWEEVGLVREVSLYENAPCTSAQ
jgi:hypothetical protein